MLVRVMLHGRRRLVIPMPLYVLDTLLRAVGDLLLFCQLLLPLCRKSLQKNLGGLKWCKGIEITMLGDMLCDSLEELRKRGRWRMVEVKNCGNEVHIDFY